MTLIFDIHDIVVLVIGGDILFFFILTILKIKKINFDIKLIMRIRNII